MPGDSALTDRNLYVQSINVNGQIIQGPAARNTAANGEQALDPSAAVMAINGAATFQSVGSKGAALPSTIVLHVSGDAYNGNAQFVVSVDGAQVGGVQTVTANHSLGQVQDITLTGDFYSLGPNKIDITFLNDAWGGSASTDRNLYVHSINVNGQVLQGSAAENNAAHGAQALDPNAAVMAINGVATFQSVGIKGVAPPSTIVLHVSGDAYNGDAQFVVSVDGVQVGGVQSVTANHSLGKVQDITLTGDFGKFGPDKIDITFLNDAWAGSAATDRNMYIESLDVNGVHFLGNTALNNATNNMPANKDSTAAAMYINGTAEFNINHTAPAAAAPAAADLAPAIPVSGMKLTFSEEFDSLDMGATGRWKPYDQWGNHWLAGNAEEQVYVDPSYLGLGINPFAVDNGILSIQSRPSGSFEAALGGRDYTSGMLSSYGPDGFSQQYGYFEMRAQLPAGTGMWPGFWLLSDNGTWPPELDVVESVGQAPGYLVQSVHSNDGNKGVATNNSENLQTSFNTYGMNWTEDTITYYFNGKETGTFATPSDMHSKMHMLLNTAVGGIWPGSPDGTVNWADANFKIDYVRVYAAAPEMAAAPVATGDTPSQNIDLGNLDQLVFAAECQPKATDGMMLEMGDQIFPGGDQTLADNSILGSGDHGALFPDDASIILLQGVVQHAHATDGFMVL